MGVVLWEGTAAGSGEVRRSLPHALGSKGVLGTGGRVGVGRATSLQLTHH